MISLLFFVIGFLLALTFTKKPIQIKIHRINEDVKPALDINLDELEAQMLKADPKKDAMYQDLDTVITQVNDIMGGSDR